MNLSKTYITLLLVVILAYLFTFVNKIGLHGDEAYFGLEAISFAKNGITSPYGITNYTGILQSLLSKVFFDYWKIDVVSLRIGGVLCNVISLLLITRLLRIRVHKMTALVFLILFAQSVFLLCYSKIAWEVTSFNFLFITLAGYSLHKIEIENKRSNWFYIFIFLSATFLGSYNHIIYSSIVLSSAVSIPIWLWINKIKPSRFILECFTLISISLFNILLLHLFMNNYVDETWKVIGKTLFVFPFLLILIEIILFKRIVVLIEKISNSLSKLLSKIRGPRKFLKFILIGGSVVVFTIIHSLKLFDVLANEIVLSRLFSYETSVVLKWFFGITSLVLFVFLIYNIVADLIKESTSFWTFLTTIYLLLFCLYTAKYSIRYYHILTILLFIFISIRFPLNKKNIRVILISIISLNAVLIQSLLWRINLDENRKIRPKIIQIGSKDHETTAHFLDFKPVMDSVNTNQIGIIHTSDKYFIGKVFDFYKEVNPKIKDYGNSATVNYDYTKRGTGYTIKNHN